MGPEIAFYHSGSSIDAWLQGHPEDSTAYVDSAATPSIQTSGLLGHSITRKALEDISGNDMPRKRRRISSSKAGEPSFEEPHTPQQALRAPYSILPDNDNTPKPFEETSNLYERGNTNDGFSAGQNSPSRSSASSTRSHSPLKRIGDLRLMGRNISVVVFENQSYPLPTAAINLLSDMRKIASGKQVIPDCLKLHTGELIASGQLDEFNFGANSNSLIPDQPLKAHSDEEVWKRVREVLYEAGLCEENCSSEPAWNTEVHSRILNLVLYGWREERHLSYNDVTTARVHGSASATKMVDYAISLDPDKITMDRIIEKLRADLSPSINHTKAEYVRFKPIVISIETKRPGMDEDTAKVQLGVWAAAHLERLKELSHGTDLPILPQILIQGHDWRLKIARMDSTGSVVIYGDLSMGETRTLLGVYKIMAGLRRLCHWAITDYRQWFDRNCLLNEDRGIS